MMQMTSIAGIPDHIVNRASDVLKARKNAQPIDPLRTGDCVDLRVEDQLALFFASISDWTNANDDDVSKFLTMARMCDQ